MPRHIGNSTSHTIAVTYDCENHGSNASENTLILPVVTSLPVPTYANGQMVFCSASGGAIAISQSGSWVVIGATGVSGIWPDNPTVSGALLFWGHPSGFEVEAGGSSGVEFWNGRSVYTNTYRPSGTTTRPRVASGEGWDGQDRVYMEIASGNHFVEDNFITPFNVTDQAFTIFTVGEIRSVGIHNYSAFATANSASINNLTQIFVGGTGNAGMGARKIDSTGTDTGHINAQYGTLDGSKHVWVWLCSGVNIRMFRDNVELTSSASGYNVGTMSSNTARIGAVDRTGGVLSEWNGFMDEMIIYAGSGLSTQQVDWITQNIAGRHNIHITSGAYI